LVLLLKPRWHSDRALSGIVPPPEIFQGKIKDSEYLHRFWRKRFASTAQFDCCAAEAAGWVKPVNEVSLRIA
jgi:hypothetical protein